MIATARIGVRLIGEPCLLFVVFDGVAELVLVNKVMTRVVGWVYVPTDFDTKEKALSVAKAAEKGLK
jgi:hypothetical protein